MRRQDQFPRNSAKARRKFGELLMMEATAGLADQLLENGIQ